MYKILIVEDDPHWAESIIELISEKCGKGIYVKSTNDCASGINLLTANEYDLAIVDIQLNEFQKNDSGLCLLRVCSIEERNIPVIVLSGIILHNGQIVNLINQYNAVIEVLFKQTFDEKHLIKLIEDNIQKPLTKKISLDVDTYISLNKKIKQNKYDVFMCHNSRDKSFVKYIAIKLLEKGLLPWLDQWEIGPGDNLLEILGTQINNIKTVAVFLGENINGSYHILEAQISIRQMVEQKKTIIPIYLNGFSVIPAKLEFLNLLTAVDFREDDFEPLSQLIKAIKQL